ncbi:MAG: response regulator [Rhodospirillales bacterium]|nr:response regulator [Rhodospirillales bacterium]QQS14640.1 MAG: response regulator [Rhodospirillales bacterium]
MDAPARILVVDDIAENRDILRARLESLGYAIEDAVDGLDALARIAASPPDLVLLDVMMPGMDGFEVCRRLRADAALPFVPIILVTARAETKDLVTGLDAGADDYLFKPFDHATLVARVRAMLRIKRLHDQVQSQARDLAGMNAELERRVAEQVREIDRIGALKRFLAPQLAEAIVARGDESVLESHRRDVSVLLCDLRGYTAFVETAEPEEIMSVLGEYHGALGPLIESAEGTLDRFTGDGLMVFFNDPLPCPDPAERAVGLAVAMRDAVAELARTWRRRGHQLGFGIGVAQGFATLGRIGFRDRFDYSAIGTTPNLAARLCAEAKDGQILISPRVAVAVDAIAALEPLGEFSLKGLARPIEVHNVVGMRT